MNIPTQLTLLRIFLIPLFIIVFYLPVSWSHLVATGIFAIASLTDWLDGHLARRWQQTSALGAFLDPVADKLLVAVVLILLLEAHPTPWMAIPTAIIIGREITISALREWMAMIGQRVKVAVSIIGKIKTMVQMIALLMMLYHEPVFGVPLYQVGFVFLYFAAILTFWSMLVYLHTAMPLLLKK